MSVTVPDVLVTLTGSRLVIADGWVCSLVRGHVLSDGPRPPRAPAPRRPGRQPGEEG